MAEYSTRLPHFSYRVLEALKSHSKAESIVGSHWLLAVSGGMDSMALWHMVDSWRQRLQLQVSVAYVHHGLLGAEATVAFRRRAYDSVARLAEERGQLFVSNFSEKMSPNDSCSAAAAEEELRDFRYSWLERWRQDLQTDFTVLAHHQEDQLETRLIRLIRGCGPEGLRAMRVIDGGHLRPLLAFSRSDIEAYAKEQQLAFIEDPSNRDLRYLRNWLRQQWLPQLEAYRPGAGHAMHRSLEGVAEALDAGRAEESPPQGMVGGILDLSRFLTLSEGAQTRQIAVYLETVGVGRFSRGQVLEVCKRLLSSRKKDSFRVAGCEWQVNAGQVKARPVDNSED